MHSFENGTSLPCKRDNWKQLQKFFTKRGIAPGGIPVTDREIEEIMASKPEAVLYFVNRMYEFLSGRRLPEILPPPPISDYYVPGFAKPTGSRIALETARGPATELLNDAGQQAASVRAALDDHARSLAADRVTDAQRYGVTSSNLPTETGNSTSSSGITGENPPPSAVPGSSGPTVTVKEVHLRKIDEESTAARLRAQKEMSVNRGFASSMGGGINTGRDLRSASPVTAVSSHGSISEERNSRSRSPLLFENNGANNGGGGISAGVFQAASLAATLGPGKVLEALNNIILDVLSAADEVHRIESYPGKPPAFAFVDMVTNPVPGSTALPDDIIVDVLQAVQRAAPAIAVACLASPRGFHHVISLLMPIIARLHDNSPALPSATDAFVAIGISMCDPQANNSRNNASSNSDNQTIAGGLFRDFALPHAISLLRHKPSKRVHILRVAYAFAGAATGTSTAGRQSFIQTLQEQLSGDTAAFIHCLAITSSLETDLGNDSLADIYVYYAVIGMASPSPHLRAAGVAILVAMVDVAPRVVDGLLPRLSELAVEDKWWQVQAGLVMVATGILRYAARVHAAEIDEPASNMESKEEVEEDEEDENGVPRPRRTGPGYRAIDLLNTIMAVEPNIAVQRIFVAHVAGILSSFPSLGPLFVDAVAALPADAREHLLAVTLRGTPASVVPDVLPLRGPSSRVYELPCIGRSLPYDIVLNALRKIKEERNLQRFEQPHLQLLLACVFSADAVQNKDKTNINTNSSSPPTSTLPNEFITAVASLQTLFFVALCDTECFALALELLRHFVLRLRDGINILSDAYLQGTLVMLHTDSGDSAPRNALAAFLADVSTRGPRSARAVSDLITAWASRNPNLYANSPLKAIKDGIKL